MRRFTRFVCVSAIILCLLLNSAPAWAAPLGASITLQGDLDAADDGLYVSMSCTEAEIRYVWDPNGKRWVDESERPYSILTFTNTSEVPVDVSITANIEGTESSPFSGVTLSETTEKGPANSLTLTNLAVGGSVNAYLFYEYGDPGTASEPLGTTTHSVTISVEVTEHESDATQAPQ